MADRRMFSKKVTETDKFLRLSHGAQAIYLHECQVADDDGFISSPQMTLRSCAGTPEMLQELVDAGYLIYFDSGIYLVTDWPENNKVQKDRYKPTIYTRERSLVEIVGKAYYLKSDPNCIHSGSNLDPQVRLEENRLDKDRLEEEPFSPPTTNDLLAYAKEIGYSNFDAEKFLNYYNERGWKNSGGFPITDWKKQVDSWKSTEKNPSNKPISKSKNHFENQRTYDYEALEKEILAN